MSRGSNVGRASWGHGGLHSVVNSTSTGVGTFFSLGGGMSIFAVQSDSTEVAVRLQGSLRGGGFVDVGPTTAWSTSQAANTIVQSKTSAPVTHARIQVKSNASTGANVWFAAMPPAST